MLTRLHPIRLYAQRLVGSRFGIRLLSMAVTASRTQALTVTAGRARARPVTVTARCAGARAAAANAKL